NIYQFITFNPKWIDISSSIEIYPGKKSLDKVKKLVEVVKRGSLSNK
ncbi:N-(5'-phosphoribosyl)anthranilate isomerase, partial [Sulfolobus sp. A20-N-G8]